jgi:hypothetical protein
MGAPINRIESRRQSDDCGVWALAVYLGIPYEVVFEKVVKIDRFKGKRGLTTPAIQRIAKALGHPLELRRRPDLSDEYGMLLVEDHVVVLRNGLVFDTDATVWDVDAWFHHHKGYSCCGLLVAADRTIRR